MTRRRDHMGGCMRRLQWRLATAALLLSLAGWACQLGSLVAMQKVCPREMHLDRNDITPVITFLRHSTPPPGQPAALPSLSQLPGVFSGALQATSTLAQRSLTTAFVMTPVTSCSSVFRYQWAHVGLQLLALLFGLIAALFGLLPTIRLALSILLLVPTMMAINSAHTWFHMGITATGIMVRLGRVFFIGCLVSIAGNLLACIILGTQPGARGQVDGQNNRPMGGGGGAGDMGPERGRHGGVETSPAGGAHDEEMGPKKDSQQGAQGWISG